MNSDNHSNNKKIASKTPRVLAITGGKGGVGKTSIAVNLAIALSRSGSDVCLFDADTALGNINIMLGLHPAYTLEHLLSGERTMEQVLVEGPESIHFVPGASGAAQCVDLDIAQQTRLVDSFQSMESKYDYMLIDTAAGISPTVLHFVAASQVAAVVITPEPTSLTDAFSLLKVLKRRGYRRSVQVIVNMAPSSLQAEKVFRRFSGAVSKYLGLSTEYLGSIWMDESMRTAVTLQRPVALFPKNDPSARSFYRLAERIDDIFARPGTPKLPFSAYWQKIVERQKKNALKDSSAPSPAQVIKQSTPSTPRDNTEGTLYAGLHNVSVPQVVANESSFDKPPVPLEALMQAKDSNKVIQSVSASFPVLEVDEQGNDESSAHSEEYDDSILEIAEQKNLAEMGGEKKPDNSQQTSENKIANSEYVQAQVSQVEKQLAERRQRKELADQLVSLSAPIAERQSDSSSVKPKLHDENSDREWMTLRVKLNSFLSSPDTTPEQATTLLSNCIISFGDRLGDAAGDLLLSLTSVLQPEQLSADQKLLLKNDFERLVLGDGQPMTGAVDVSSLLKQKNPSDADSKQDIGKSPINPKEDEGIKVRYDQQGFGSQDALAQQIRSNNDQSLDSMLESIKYASMVGSGSEESSR